MGMTLFFHHPSIYTPISFKGPGGGPEPIPADIVREVGYTLDSSPTYRGANIQTHITIHPHTFGQVVSN